VHITAPRLSAEEASVEINTTFAGSWSAAAKLQLRTVIKDPQGAEVAREAMALTAWSDGETTIKQTLRVPTPQRWDIDTPQRYTVVSEIVREGQTVDAVETRFGVREIRWEAATGFWLNGRNVKLLGVAEHMEGGPVGAAWPKALIRWKLELLKSMGVNAVRTAHNPQVPAFYEICDELGLLVMNEVFDGWLQKAPQDYGAQAFDEWWERDLRAIMRRDRNHPCIVIWSVGNETRGPIGEDLVRVCHEMDATRPVTSGHAGYAFMDVLGVNGHSERPRFFDEPPPEKPFVATEAPHTWQVRGFYRTKTWFRDGFPNRSNDPFPLPDLTPEEIFNYDWVNPADRGNPKQIFNSSYDNAMVRITARRNWTLMRDIPWFSGHFRWTGWDYLGEAGYVHGGWPFRAFMGGVLDLAGFPKDHFYFYQSQWTETPMVHLLPHWTHPVMALGTKIPVWAYANAEEVELWLNGRSLGRRPIGTEWDQLQGEWLVPWEPGVLEAIAYRGGKEVARTQQRTAGAPAALRVTSEMLESAGDVDAMSIVTIASEDAEGTFQPFGENRVQFRLEGPARFRSLENGNPVDTEPNFGPDSRRLFFGLTRAFVEIDRTDAPVGLWSGAILGEKRQLTSDRVSIVVDHSTLRGAGDRNRAPMIRYTLDGSEPSANSPIYREPIGVKLGTTVRAKVYADGIEVLSMSERFAANEGLHWGAADEGPAPKAVGAQAEVARYEGAEKAADLAGFKGSGYLRFAAAGGRIEWYQENDGSPGSHRLTVRYGADYDGELQLSINGGDFESLQPDRFGMDQEQWRTGSMTGRLESGGNQIRLRVPPGKGVGVAIDELQMHALSESPRIP
jgi:beta-galactosidase